LVKANDGDGKVNVNATYIVGHSKVTMWLTGIINLLPPQSSSTHFFRWSWACEVVGFESQQEKAQARKLFREETCFALFIGLW